MTADGLAGAVTTRVATLALTRRGRARGLTYDDYMVRAALVVDWALAGVLQETADAMVPSREVAADAGLAEPLDRLTASGDSLERWVYAGGYGFADWGRLLLAEGVWHDPERWWQPGPRYRPVDGHLAAEDRAAARSASGSPDWPPQRLAVVAIGSVSALFRPRREPPPLDGLGSAAWAGHLAVDTLQETRTRLRSNGRIAD